MELKGLDFEQFDIKELIYHGHLIPGYYIRSTDGQLFSTRSTKGINRYTSHNKELVCYGDEIRPVKGWKDGKYTLYRIGKKFTYREKYPIKRSYFTILAHRAVMETFSPFENNLPNDLTNEWINLSSNVKKYIIDGMTIDHKESLDENFNGLSNLQWMSRSENAMKSDKQPTILEKLLWN